MREFDYIGKYEIIDGHTHIHGPMYKNNPEVSDRLLFPIITADELVAHMKNYGINRSITFPIHWNSSDVVYDLSYHTPNDHIAEAQKKYPDNLIGFGRVQPNYKEDAEKETRRCLEELGLKGIKVQPNVENISMSDVERWGPVMELLAKHNYPLYAHSSPQWNTCSPGRFFKLAETFPDVNIVMSHSCFWYAYDAMMVAKHCDNIYLGLSYIGARFIWEAVEMGLEDRLVYESDTPFYYPSEPILRIVDHPKLTEQQKIDILGGNLARILKIKL